MIFHCYLKNKDTPITTKNNFRKIRTPKKHMIRSQTNNVLYNIIENDDEYFNESMFNKLILSSSNNTYNKYNHSHNDCKVVVKVTKIALQKPSIDILNLNYISSPEQKN
jgi:hypothetical protein